jgi:hypothetical protein
VLLSLFGGDRRWWWWWSRPFLRGWRRHSKRLPHLLLNLLNVFFFLYYFRKLHLVLNGYLLLLLFCLFFGLNSVLYPPFPILTLQLFYPDLLSIFHWHLTHLFWFFRPKLDLCRLFYLCFGVVFFQVFLFQHLNSALLFIFFLWLATLLRFIGF